MKVTIHQPEHFPYMGFFQKMQAADLFIVLDNVKYRKNYFLNRNKFVNKNGIDEWFTIPINKSEYDKKIHDVVLPSGDWRMKIQTKLRQNLGYIDHGVYDNDLLVNTNIASIEWCRQKLGIDNTILRASQLNVSFDESDTKTSKLIKLLNAVNAKHYISGPSGKDYLDIQQFDNENITVEFFEPSVSNHYSALYNILKQ
jgi:hypothetical protein